TRGIGHDHRDRTRWIVLRRGAPDRSQNCDQRHTDREIGSKRFILRTGCSLGLWMTVGSYRPLTLVRETLALLGAPIRHLGRLPAMRRRGVEIGHLVVAVEREDARLRATGEIRERASFDLDGD